MVLLLVPDCIYELQFPSQTGNAIPFLIYSKTCVKPPLKNRQNKDLRHKWYVLSLMKFESIAECSPFDVCNTFDMDLSIIGLENQFVVFLRVAVLHWFLL